MSWVSNCRAASATLLVLAAAGSGCGPSPDAPLPPESDLYAYSLAVAEKARLKAPRHEAEGIYRVGKVHERFGLEDKALEIYRSALEVDRNFADAYKSIGFILSQRKDRMADAIDAYQHCLRCEPGARGILTRMGLIFTHMGKLDEALVALNSEVRDGTADQNTYYEKGQVLFLQGKYDESIASHREALRLYPQMRRAFYGMAQALRAAGKQVEAEEAEGKFIEIRKKEDAAEAAQGEQKTNRGDHLRYASSTWMDAASLFALEANDSKGDSERVFTFRKEFRFALGEAIRLAPGELEPRKVLVDSYKERQDYLAAARACREGLKAQPKEPVLWSDAYDLAGRILEPYGRNSAPNDVLELSLQLLDLILEARPSHADAHREAAKIILFRRQDRTDLLETAFEHADQAVKIDGSAANYDVLALAYHNNGRPDLALRSLERGIELHPESQELRDRLEKLHASQGK